MHECCAKSVAEAKGCCGKDAAALKADFNLKAGKALTTACAVEAGMHECCAKSLAEAKGCCGKDAAALKADFNKKSEEVQKKLASN